MAKVLGARDGAATNKKNSLSLEDKAPNWSQLTLSWFTKLMNIAKYNKISQILPKSRRIAPNHFIHLGIDGGI